MVFYRKKQRFELTGYGGDLIVEDNVGWRQADRSDVVAEQDVIVQFQKRDVVDLRFLVVAFVLNKFQNAVITFSLALLVEIVLPQANF